MKFGQKIIVSHKLIRTREKDRKQWVERKIKPKQVMVIGKRTLRNGFIDYTEEYIAFSGTESFSAFLVVENMREKPFYVLRGNK